jgi:N6-L-threonylcarbamoyladenine synthase
VARRIAGGRVVIDGPILAIETSCDETAAAVVHGRRISSNVVASQADLHSPYGGVVPEVAARHHVGTVNAVVDEALGRAGLGLADVAAVAVTSRPGLIGALLVGVATAKALAYAARTPLVMVDHLHGHVAAVWLEPVALDPPFVSLVASGGHTRLDLVHDLRRPRLLGETIDDAAGEALDKGARLLGLGYPGGAALERLAAGGDREAFRFPIGLAGSGRFDFSFAGVKTALLYAVRELGDEVDARKPDLAASYQEAVVRPLADRLVAAARRHGAPAVAMGGGVAANGRLRELAVQRAEVAGLRLAVPERSLCTDNAAMIGAAAQFTEPTRWPDFLALDAVATAPPGGIAA